MGPELGSDCRNLVVPMVVTQGHLFGFVWSFFFFLILGDVAFPRCRNSLSISFCLLLKHFHFTTCLSLSTETQAAPHTHSLLLQLPSLPRASPVFTCLRWPVSPGFLLILTVYIPVKKGAARLTWSGGPGVQEL